MSIFRIKKHENPYVILDKTCLEEDALSWRAKGIHAYLISKPDDWQVRLAQLIAAGKDGREAVRSAIKELSEAGYLHRVAMRQPDGTLQGQEWSVYESPFDRTTGNPSDGEDDATKARAKAKKDKEATENSTPKPLSLGTKPQPPNPPVPPTHEDRPDAPPPQPPAPAMESQPTPATAQPAYAVAHWNALADECGLPKLRNVAGSRHKHLKARVASDEQFWNVLELQLPLLEGWAKGEGQRKWTIDFDWIVASETNYCKLAEGKFSGKVQAKASESKGISATERF